jgi:hypothetical protein
VVLDEQQYQWLAVRFTDRVQLGGQAPFGPPDTAGNSPFFTQARRGAVRFEVGLRPLLGRLLRSNQREGIMTVLDAVRSGASAANIRSNTPARLQRTKRLYKV